jgi:hypothetical protein
MKTIICDICNEHIEGDYMEVYPASTLGIARANLAEGKKDLCMKCWDTFKNTRRIPLVEFPNSEAKDHE